MSETNTLVLDDANLVRLIELTDGAAALCYQCGVCTATCPWGLVRDEPLSVRTLIRRAQLGLQDGNINLWLCTTCAQCEADCPRGVRIADIMHSLRLLAWERAAGATPTAVEKGLPSLLWSIYWNENPWSQPPSMRMSWAKNLVLPAFDLQAHEILLYIGCTSSYDPRAQKIARQLVRVLQAAGVRFGVLGDREPCCGEAALSVGHRPYFEEIARHTARVLTESGAQAMVTISPHCYDVFANHYPTEKEFELPAPLHYTQYLHKLLEQGRLRFEHPLEVVCTYQDPCYLGRHNSEYEAPRRVLSAIPGLQLVEMERSREDGLCCGGGGGRMWLDTPVEQRFSNLRIREAQATGALLLATACPFCAVCLEDSARLAGSGSIQVLDVAEIAALALDHPAVHPA
jgi:Fe-S oxidoreductase